MVAPLPDWMKPETDDNWDSEDVAPQVTSYSFYKDSPEGEVTLYYDDSAHAYYRFDADGNRVEIPGVTTVLQIIDKSKPLMLWAVKLAIMTIQAGLHNADGSRKELSTEDLNWLLNDARTKHSQELEEAGDVGHIVHGILEEQIKLAIKNNNGVLQPLDFPPTDERVKNSTGAAFEWTQKHKVRFIFTERKVYSREYDVAGTGDGLAWVSSCDDPSCCSEEYVDRLAFIDWKTSRSMRTTYILQTAIYRFCYIEETGEPVTDTWVLKLDKETGKLTSLHRSPNTFEMELEAFLAALNLYRRMKDVEESIRVDKAKRKAIGKAIRDEAKAVLKAEAKATSIANREASKLATKARNEAQKAHYKQLRADGVPVDEAKALAYPKVEKTAAEIADEIVDEMMGNLRASAPTEPTIAPIEEPFQVEWELKL